MLRPILLTSLVLLAGCMSRGPLDDACGALGYQSLVGQQLAAVTLPAELETRVIEPGTAVTLDHRPDRLNIEVDATGRITRVRCG